VSVHVGRLGAVAGIVLDRPPVNAFDEAQVDALAGALLTAFATR
jgi:enoyl-CoA hydratase/carnithine racemase